MSGRPPNPEAQQHRENILAFLEERPHTIRELAAIIGISKGRVYAALRALGLLVRSDEGCGVLGATWSLAPSLAVLRPTPAPVQEYEVVWHGGRGPLPGMEDRPGMHSSCVNAHKVNTR